jgi:hypothetical protein
MINLILGLVVMAICLLLQSGLMVLAMRHYARNQRLLESTTFGTSLILVSSVMFLLVLGNLAQIIIWAALFQSLGEFTDFRAAIYHSAVNFATLGYGDIVMSEKHRILGPLEAINGVLMIGVSTAALTAAFGDVVKRKLHKEAKTGNGPREA